jgi:hypothetical protein
VKLALKIFDEKKNPGLGNFASQSGANVYRNLRNSSRLLAACGKF